MKNNLCTEFCKNTLHKSYNFTTYSNITIKRTLHKIIITHITFIFTKRSFFKHFKHMMHNLILITLNWLFKNLSRHIRGGCFTCGGRKGATSCSKRQRGKEKEDEPELEKMENVTEWYISKRRDLSLVLK